MKTKKWLILCFIASLPILIFVATVIIIIDPYFHYRRPNTNKFFYELSDMNERYINDGITMNFDYDAIITGTSMSENFKTTQFDNLFGCTSIKVPYRGGTIFEVSSNLKRAFINHDVKYIVRSLDYYMLNVDSNKKRDFFSYPEYLYNNNIIDDIKYVLNEAAFFESVKIIKTNFKKVFGITSFDEYANWMSLCKFGKDIVLAGRTSFDAPSKITDFTKLDEERVRNNIKLNIIDFANLHSKTQYYIFLPPYSIAKWGSYYEEGILGKILKEEALTARMLVQCKNIHLFSFNSRKDWILNLDRYKDTAHYDEQINSEILRLMKEEEDKYRITKENVEEYIKAEEDFFTNFDYNSIF